jgi:hypothetical protein
LFNHYSLLATAEQLLGLPKLGLAVPDVYGTQDRDTTAFTAR